MTTHMFSLLLTGWLLRDVCHLLLGVFSFLLYFILEHRPKFTVRRHILYFLLFLIFIGAMRKEKAGKKKMEERQEEREKEVGELGDDRGKDRGEDRGGDRRDRREDRRYRGRFRSFHDRQRKEALWAEISAQLKLQPFDVRRWFESQRTRYGKLSKQQSGQAPREMTKRQSWVYQQMGFL